MILGRFPPVASFNNKRIVLLYPIILEHTALSSHIFSDFLKSSHHTSACLLSYSIGYKLTVTFLGK